MSEFGYYEETAETSYNQFFFDFNWHKFLSYGGVLFTNFGIFPIYSGIRFYLKNESLKRLNQVIYF